MTRKVLLQKDINKRLETLTSFTEEVNGVLLYQRQGDYCPVEAIFMTGVGSSGNVQSRPERIEIVNEFFKRKPNYQFIKFHTHSKGTINKFDRYYARHFSQWDLDGIKKQLTHDREFIALLVTPETKILSGIDNPELIFVPDFLGYHKRNQAVSQSLKAIAKDLGYDLHALQASLK